jgi:hypothetical protein
MAMVFNHNKRNIVAKGREKRRGVVLNTSSKAKQKSVVSDSGLAHFLITEICQSLMLS